MQSDIEVGPEVFGFVDDRRQYHRWFRINLPALTGFDEPAAMAFLEATFALEPERVTEPANRSGRKPSHLELGYLKVSLGLARSLLRTSGIPSFETETITDFPARGAANRRPITLTIPVVDHIPGRLYLVAYKAALRLMFEFTRPASQRTTLMEQADALEDELIKPLKHVSNCRPIDIYLLREAFDRGIQADHLGLANYRFGLGAQALLVFRSSTERDSAIGSRVSQDKTAALHWLRHAGIPTPRSIEVPTVEKAQAAAREIGFPVVIKPADRDRSEGVTMDITSEDQVAAGFDAAREFSDRILVEQRVPGVCHRLVTFRNRFVFAFTRHPKAVVGDGTRTVAQLVAEESAKRARKAAHLRPKPFPLDAEALDRLAEQGLAPASIPEAERIVLLRRNNTVAEGGHNETITDTVHPENIRLAERISRILRLDSMGLDLISTDPTRPWFETGACITEVNSVPQIGDNSARAYLDSAFGEATGTIPVHCIVGDAAALDRAREMRETLAGSGASAVLTARGVTLGPDGEEIVLHRTDSLFDRTAGLLNDPRVEALILVVQDDELVIRGRPVLEIASLEVVNRALVSFRDPTQSLEAAAIDAVVAAIEAALPRSPAAG